MLYSRAAIFASAVLFTTLCHGRVFDRSIFSISARDATEDVISIAARAPTEDIPQHCYPICQPDTPPPAGSRRRSTCGSYGSCTSKRSFSDNVDASNSSDTDSSVSSALHKRFFYTPMKAHTIDAYLDKQGKATPGAGQICPPKPYAPWVGYSYCLQQEFSTAPLNSDGQWLAGTADTLLTGCTVLTVVSPRAVYMCHFWEDLNYLAQRSTNGGVRDPVGFQPILNLVQSGTHSQYVSGAALKTSLYTGENDKTWAFIMTPRRRDTDGETNENSQLYTQQHDSLAALLKKLVPSIQIKTYNYWPWPSTPVDPAKPDGDKKYANEYQGVALFEYDPNSDKKGKADWRLWLENSKILGTKLGQAVVGQSAPAAGAAGPS